VSVHSSAFIRLLSFAWEHQLRKSLGTKVEIRQTSRGRGRIVIHFADRDEFERMYQQLAESGPSPMDVKVA
jgi:ParB family chromosome partitioning protein